MALETPVAADEAEPTDDSVKLVLVGDVGLNRNRQRVRAEGFQRGKRLYKWSELTANIAKLINGDINFMNMETVVTESNKLRAQKKGVNFRTHPNGFRHLLSLGFNLVSGANNHTADYGSKGVLDTLRYLHDARKQLLGHAGLGKDNHAATAPASFRMKGKSFSLSALGITSAGRRAGKHKPGCAGPRFKKDWAKATRRLRNTGSQFRMLSVHEGPERRVRPTTGLRRKWRSAMADGSADLVIGHHSHVARGVERNKDGFIFYGLGNFLLEGDRNLRNVWSYRLCRDFGLLARVYIRPNARGRMTTRAIEIVPITGVSRIPKPMAPAVARKRVRVINYLAGMLDDKKRGATGVRFAPQTDGSGLYCVPGADKDPGRVGHLCRRYRKPAAVSRKLKRQLRYSCRVLSASERNPDPLYQAAPATDRRRWK